MSLDLNTVGSEITLDNARDTLLVSVAVKSTWGGMLGSVYGWLTQTDSAIFIGIVITLLGFVMNYFFQRFKAKREAVLWQEQLKSHLRAEERREELHAARLFSIRNGNGLEVFNEPEQ